MSDTRTASLNSYPRALTPVPCGCMMARTGNADGRQTEGAEAAMARAIAGATTRRPVYSSSTSRSPLWHLRDLVQRRNLIWELTARNLKVRYRRSIFGFLWAILNPLCNALVFSFVFSILLKTSIERFALFITIALVAWNAFSASVLESMSIVTGTANLVTRVRFPSEALPIATVLTNMINFVLATPSILIIMLLTRSSPHIQMVLYPLVLVCLFCFALGIAFLSAATNVFFRDTRNFLDVVMSLWFFLTPIIYNLDTVFVSSWGQRLVYWLNPMASIITLFRHMFYTGYWDAPTFVTRTLVASVMTMIAGWLFFIRLSEKFVEEL
ncbi:MAG: ABC transporter permease [Thermomicrobiales bacterium]